MKMGKIVALMGLGAGAVLAYQKYSKPVMNKAKKSIDKAMHKTNQKLDEMM